jgi:hypothetical protein
MVSLETFSPVDVIKVRGDLYGGQAVESDSTISSTPDSRRWRLRAIVGSNDESVSCDCRTERCDAGADQGA